MIRVRFLEDGTGKVLHETKIAPDDLPETFALETTVQIGEESFKVVAADPVRREDAAKAGGVTLHVCRYTAMDVGGEDIYYSMPTIENTIPAMSSTRVDGSELLLHEDDWRQVEFVHARFLPVIDEIIEEIRAVWAAANDTGPFKGIALRSKLPDPLGDTSMSAAKFVEALDPGGQKKSEVKGLAFRGYEHRVAGGFALHAHEEMWWYGVEREGKLEALCLGGDTSAGLIGIDGLVVVDWCRCYRQICGSS